MKYGVRWSEFGRDDRLTTKEKFFKSEEARAKAIEKIEAKPNFHEILGYCEEAYG